MKPLPRSAEAYKLLREGSLALAQAEAHGIHVDVDYLQTAMRRTDRRAERIADQLRATDVWRVWSKRFGTKANLTSNDQLGAVLFDEMKHPYPHEERTAAGRYRTDEKTLAAVDHPFVVDYLKMKKLQKASSTYLRGILREAVDGVVHPVFNLHIPVTYRGSSDSPNFQNMPIRDPEMGQLIRQAFVSRGRRLREEWQLVEVDYSGIEVRIAACYHHDPRMEAYIRDPATDMHRDMAMELFRLPQAEVTKPIRHTAKNQFVFPQFYGDWYIDCTRGMWNTAEKLRLTTASGVSLLNHLKAQGIRTRGVCVPKQDPKPGTFEAHVRAVERRFWEQRFSVYNQWRKDWYEAYRKCGWFAMHTGFVCQGYMSRNEVINYPVQGAAFHCLLWTFTRLVQKELRRAGLRAIIVGQIHDSIVADVPAAELHEFLAVVNRVATKDLLRHWEWISVPLEIEAEAAPVGGTWADKQKVEIAA